MLRRPLRLLRTLALAAAGIASTGFVAPSLAQVRDLPTARPESVGLSSERLARLTATLQADAAAKKLPGAVVMVVRQGKLAYQANIGQLDPVAGTPMREDGIFRIYSMTKPIVSVAAMMLVEDGRLKLDDPVAKFIPSFAKTMVGVEKPGADGKPTLELVPQRRPMTVQDLLRHTSGITYGFFGQSAVKSAYNAAGLGEDMTTADFVEKIAALPLHYQPGSTWDYSYSTDVVGRVIEVVTGQSLGSALRTMLFDPLGMVDTGFGVPDAARHARIAEPFADDRNFGVGASFSEPRKPLKFESGGGGLVSTANDYARFLLMLRNGGELDGRRFLSPKTLAYMTSDHLGPAVVKTPLYLPGPGFGFGLGFGVRTAAGEAAFPGGVGTYYWGGAGGTYMWVDPANDVFVVFMMQSPRARVHYRGLLHNMVTAAIVK